MDRLLGDFCQKTRCLRGIMQILASCPKLRDPRGNAR
jgi:hypothetical protein